MKTPHFLARQLACPSGIFGRFVIRPLLNRANAAHNRLVLEALAVTSNEKVLEVGFGSGYLLRKLARQITPSDIVGIDLSATIAKATRRKFSKDEAMRMVHVLVGSADTLPIPDAHFHKACAVNVVYFWKDISATLAELHRVVRPRGSLVLGIGSDTEMRKAGLDERGFNLYSVDDLLEILQAHGFSEGRITEYKDSLGTGYALAVDRMQ